MADTREDESREERERDSREGWPSFSTRTLRAASVGSPTQAYESLSCEDVQIHQLVLQS